MGTDEIVVLATGAQTGGTIFAVEIRMPPGGGPPVMHRHRPGEIYHVLEGEFTFYVGDPGGAVRRVTARAGDVVPLAGGTPHTIRNESARRRRGVRRALARPARWRGSPGPPPRWPRAAPPSMEQVLALAQEHGVELLGPIPALR